MTDWLFALVVGFVALVCVGAVERLYRIEQTLGRINNLLADLCDHLRVKDDEDGGGDSRKSC